MINMLVKRYRQQTFYKFNQLNPYNNENLCNYTIQGIPYDTP